MYVKQYLLTSFIFYELICWKQTRILIVYFTAFVVFSVKLIWKLNSQKLKSHKLMKIKYYIVSYQEICTIDLLKRLDSGAEQGLRLLVNIEQYEYVKDLSQESGVKVCYIASVLPFITKFFPFNKLHYYLIFNI